MNINEHFIDIYFQMDFHCRSRGHKKKTDDAIPCKKCDYIAENKDDNWNHKKVSFWYDLSKK